MKWKYILLIAVVAIFSLVVFTHFHSSNLVNAHEEKRVNKIAGIEIDSKKRANIKVQLASSVSEWKEKGISVEGITATVIIPSEFIHIHLDETIETFLSSTSTPWYQFSIKKEAIQLPLQVTIDDEVRELLKQYPFIKVDETVAAIEEHAKFLLEGPVEAIEIELMKENMERIASVTARVPASQYNLSYIVDVLDEWIIKSGERFSFLETLKEVDHYYSDETANVVASILYNTVLQTQMKLAERHPQHTVPSYLHPGLEARVDKDRNLDLAFFNLTDHPYMIGAFLNDGKLTIELYSTKKELDISLSIRETERIEPKRVYRYSDLLPLGREYVMEEGKDGLRIEVSKTITNKSGNRETIVVSNDFYPPKNKIVFISSREKMEPSITNDETDEQMTEEDEEWEEPQFDKAGNLIHPHVY